MLLTFDKNEVKGLKLLAGADCLEFLGYVLNLDSGEIRDLLAEPGKVEKLESEVLQVLLAHYAKSTPVQLSGEHIKFADLPGGHAYEKAFLQRAVQPVAKAFGTNPERIIACVKQLGGRALSFGDCSVEIMALPHLPLTIIIWRGGEFPAEASVLFDRTASDYLPTEDLAVMGELTVARIMKTFGNQCS